MIKILGVFLTVIFSSQATADGLANGGEVLELFSVSTLVGPGNTTADESFVTKIAGGGLCEGKYIKFQTNVNSVASLNRSFSMLTAAYISGQPVSIQGAYSNSNCVLGSQVRLIKN